MRFIVQESTYNNQGSEKAFAAHDQYNRVYWIPRSQVKIIDKIAAENEYDMAKLIIEIPDWLVRKNQLPIFSMTELFLDR